MHAYILLDRTGSMQSLWDEALGAVNTYVKGLGDAHVTLAVFDANDGLQFDVLRAGVPAATCQPVTSAEASPRGMTPLFDAVGRMVAIAEKDDPARAVLVIMTDGQENASRELKKADVKAAIERIERRGWQVAFLGADFANFQDADAIGVMQAKRMAMAPGKVGASMAMFASKSRAYFDQGVDINFDAKDRTEAGEADVQQRKGDGRA